PCERSIISSTSRADWLSSAIKMVPRAIVFVDTASSLAASLSCSKSRRGLGSGSSARGRAEGESTNKAPLDGKSTLRITGREKAIFPGAYCAVKRTMTAVAQLVLRGRKRPAEDRINLVELALQV